MSAVVGTGRCHEFVSTPSGRRVCLWCEAEEHGHAQPCPDCGRWAEPFDDEPYPEGREWTSAYRCRACPMVWTAAWSFPDGVTREEES